MKTKKILSAVLVAVLLMSSLLPCFSFASNISSEDQAKIDDYKERQAALNEKIEAAKEKINELQGSIDEKQAYADKLSAEIDEYQADIDELSAEIDGLEADKAVIQTDVDGLNDEIDTIQKKIDKNEAEVERTQAEIDDVYEKFKQRLCEIYVNGSASELELLLDCTSKDFESYLIMIEVSQRRAANDTEMVNKLNDDIARLDKLTAEYNAMIAEIDIKKSELEDKISELESKAAVIDEARGRLEDSQDELVVLQTEAFSYIKDLDAESDTYKNLVDQYEAEKAKFDEMIDKIIAESASTGTGQIIQSGGFIWPLQFSDVYISSPYGYRYDPITGVYKFHGGTDTCRWSGTYNQPVVASASGTVITAGYNAGGYGYYVLIDHGNGICTLYGHNNSLAVSYGQHVSQGQVIAYSGKTGYATGNHVHFEVRVNGTRVDPTGYASKP